MPIPPGFRRQLAQGVAQYLAAQGVGTWSPTAAYPTGVTGLVVGDLPQAPVNVIALATYGVDDDPSLSDSVIGLQVIARADGIDPRPTGDITDAVFNVLHGATNLTLPTGVQVVECLRKSMAPLGRDTNGRLREASNFYATVHQPSSNRT